MVLGTWLTSHSWEHVAKGQFGQPSSSSSQSTFPLHTFETLIQFPSEQWNSVSEHKLGWVGMGLSHICSSSPRI